MPGTVAEPMAVPPGPTPRAAGLHIISCIIRVLTSTTNVEIYFFSTYTWKSVIVIKTKLKVKKKKGHLPLRMQM